MKRRTEAEKQELVSAASKLGVAGAARNYRVDPSVIYRYMKAHEKEKKALLGKTYEINWQAGKKSRESRLETLVADLMLEVKALRG